MHTESWVVMVVVLVVLVLVVVLLLQEEEVLGIRTPWERPHRTVTKTFPELSSEELLAKHHVRHQLDTRMDVRYIHIHPVSCSLSRPKTRGQPEHQSL